MNYFGGPITTDGVIKIKERADDAADEATYGQIWVKSDDGNVLMFTDGDGTKYTVDLTPV